MPNPAFTAFNGGELSPLMAGRIDFAKYASGCDTLLNFVPTVQGPVRRRQGFRFVSEVKQSSNRTWLARFEFSITQSFILEFGHLYVRFYTNHGPVLLSGVPYEVATPYTAADLITSEGTFALSMAQSADVIYIAHRNFAPRKLSRFGNTNWTMTTLDNTGGPFADVNKDDAVTVYASAQTGNITLTANTSIFTAADVGSLFYLEAKDSNGSIQWEVNREFGLGVKITSDGKYYISTSSPISPATKQYSGTVRPTHIIGRAFDGSRNNGPVQQETSQTVGIEWEYLHSGFGWVRITGFNSGTSVNATVLSRLPDNVVSSVNATFKWAYGDWSGRNKYPSHVTFFRERLTFAGGQKLWFSVTGDYENFTPKQSNVVADDDAINVTISSDQVNDVTWIIPQDSLLIGTGGGEFACSENSSSDPFATRNIKITQQSRFGGRNLQPQVVSSQTLFVQRAGRKMREIAYSFERDSYASNDVTVLSEHVTLSGLIQLSYQQEPDAVVWGCTSAGVLLGLTYNREQDVIAWHQHAIGGQTSGGNPPVVESIQVVPTPDGTSEELWMVVRRTIGGQTKRYVEYMTQNWQISEPLSSAVFLDSSLVYSGAPATVISGLAHLEGQTVSILADGATHPDRTVVNGQITLQIAASIVQIGLGYSSQMTTMRIEAGGTQGTSQGQKKKFSKVHIRLLGTVGAKYGSPDQDLIDLVPFRDSSMPMNQAVTPFTGDKECQWPAGWEQDGRLTIIQDQPLPMTIVGLYPEMKTSA